MKKSTRKSKLAGTPRPYISWSQLSLFERSPQLYENIYILGEKKEETPEMKLGKELAEARKTRKTKNPAIKHLLDFMPKYPKREVEISAVIDGIPIMGKLDGFDPKKLTIGEDKASRKFTQAIVDSHGQLTFYAALVYAKYKKLPKRIFLHWARTEDSENGPEFTGEVKTFETKRTLRDIGSFLGRIRNGWAGIQWLTKKSYAKIK